MESDLPQGLEADRIGQTLQITAITVSYNSATVLPSCIEAVCEHLAPAQLLVVDNASTDISIAVAREHGAEVIVNPFNGGFGAGCNLGARAAKNELLAFVNPDVRLTSVDSAMLAKLATRSPFGLIAPRVLHAADGDHQEPARRKTPPWPYVVAREALGPVIPREASDRIRSAFNDLGGLSWLWGAVFLANRTEFLKLGGFDERFFLYYEDLELSRRYTKHGLPLSVTDAIAGRHVGGGSSDVKGASRSIPRAASAMSSIEMIGIIYGPRAARSAWTLYRGLQRCATALVALIARGPLSSRSTHKLEELRSTQSAIDVLLTEHSSHYPLVKTLARRAS